MDKIIIEGYTIDELNSLIGTADFEELIFTEKPVVFNAGSAEILGQFSKERNELHVDLAHIEGGGEGILIAINSMAKKYAIEKDYDIINWYVHATNCAKPNPKLQRILRLREFEITTIEGKGSVFYKRERVNNKTTANNT